MTRTPLPAATGLKRGITQPPPRRPTPAPSALRAVQEDAVEASSTAPTQPQPAEREAASKDSSGRVVHTSVNVPTRLIEQVSQRPRGTTVFDVVAEALQESISKLEDLVEAEQGRTMRTDALFPDMIDRSVKREPTGTLNIRTTEKNMRQLDQMVRIYKAESRSQLITAALRHHASA